MTLGEIIGGIIAVGALGAGIGWLIERWLESSSEGLRTAALCATFAGLGSLACLSWSEDLITAGVPVLLAQGVAIALGFVCLMVCAALVVTSRRDF